MLPPNFRDAECCQWCNHGEMERSRCGDYIYYCTHNKHHGEVSETSICDDYDAKGEMKR